MRAVLVVACVAGCATAEPPSSSLDASAKADVSVAAPAIVAGQGGACRANITLTWAPVPSASYDLEWGFVNQPNAHSLSFPAGTTTAELTNVGPGNYSWRVRASINSTPSAWSSSSFVITPGAAGLFDAKPADFKANVGSQTIATSRGVILDGPDIGSGTEGVFVAATNTTIMGGEHDYTSFTIAKGVTVTVVGGPLLLAVTGAIDIEGTLDASGARGGDGVSSSSFGKGGVGAAGAGDGGDGVLSGNPAPGHDGVGLGKGFAGVTWQGGSGGGFASVGGTSASSKFGAGVAGGVAYGTIDLLPLFAGSGGGGGSGSASCGSGGGGGGGGALKLTAGQSLTIGATGVVRANGGAGGGDGGGGCGGGGGGSGGTIWLVSRTLTHDGVVEANGGAAGASALTKGGVGSAGRVRFDGLLTGNGTSSPQVGYAGDFVYAPFGTSTSPLISPANLCGWGALGFDITAFPGTSVQVDVIDANDKVLVADASNSMNLSSLDASSIKLRATLRTNDVKITPALRGWSVGYTAQ